MISKIFVSDSDYKTGFLNRLFHIDVDSTHGSLSTVAGKTNSSLQNLLKAHNLAVDKIDIHTGELSNLTRRVDLLEMHHETDSARVGETVTVVEGHARDLATLQAEKETLATRVSLLEEQRKSDQAFEAHTITQIEDHSRRIVLLETSLQKTDEKTSEAVAAFKRDLEPVASSAKASEVKIDRLHFSCEELTAKLTSVEKAQAAANERQEVENRLHRTQMVEMAELIHSMRGKIAELSAWKEESTRKHERHENILLYCHKLQSNLSEIIANMSQEQQYLFHISQGMDTKLGLLLEKSGIQTPKVEMPQAADSSTSFREILTCMRDLRHAFDAQ